MKTTGSKKNIFRNFIGATCFIIFYSVTNIAIAQISIIPRPVSIQLSTSADSFVFSSGTVMITQQASLKPSIDFFSKYLQTVYGFSAVHKKKSSGNSMITLEMDTKLNTTPGAYELEVSKEKITIKAAEETGVFYGMQTLIQLLTNPSSISKNTISIPSVVIKDQPRFAYRGMMLDVSRHFFPVTFVKKYIDYLALHKFNYFHWHLTEDQGWRIEIKKYPKLTTVSSYRNGSLIGRYPGKGNDGIRHGGFYLTARDCHLR